MTETFFAAVGHADPPASDGISQQLANLPGDLALHDWSQIATEIQPGYYHERFFYLFGDAVARYAKCLEHWSFLLPDDKVRAVVGVNAYGSLLTMEANKNGGGQIGVLETLTAQFTTKADWYFLPGLFSKLIPEKQLDLFCNDFVYKQWRAAEKRFLKQDEILAIGMPLPLGGAMSLENFGLENIFSFYENRADIYKTAHAKRKR